MVWAGLYLYNSFAGRPYPVETVPVVLVAVSYLLGSRVLRGMKIVRENGKNGGPDGR